MLKLLLLLLVLEAPQDRSGSPPLTGDSGSPASSIRISPRPSSAASPTSAIRSGEKTAEAPWGSSSSTKVRASRPRGGVTRDGEEFEEKGWGNGAERRAWGSATVGFREEEEEEGSEAEEEERPWRRACNSNS